MNPGSDDISRASFTQRMLWGLDRGAFQNELGQRVVDCWSLGVVDPVVAGLAEDILRPFIKKQALGRLPPFKAPRLPRGELLLGKDLHGTLIWLLLEWLKSGVLIVSNTGGGKSNLLCFLMLQLAALHCPIWLSESYKIQLRHLRRLLRRAGVDLIIIRPHDWRWNLLQSHLENPRSHLNLAVDLLARVLGLLPRARMILGQGCHFLYQQYGIWQGNTGAWPTLFDLYEWVRKTPGLNTQARDAILDRLASLLVSLTPRCAAYRVAWNPAELANHSIDFEMRGATETVKQVLLESLLFAVFQREVERGVVNGPLRLVIALDDSQRFFDTSAQLGSGELTPMDELAGVIRGTGISLWVIAQTSVGLSRRLLPNLALKIIGRLGSHEDYANLGADLGMDAEQINYARLQLQPGQFIGQMAHDWREPFVFRVPLLQFPDRVDDLEAAESVKELDVLPTVFADEFAHWSPQPVVEAASTPTSPQTLVLSEIQLRYLKAVVDQPGQPSGCYARLAGINGQRAAEVRQQLVAGGYLREHSVATGGRGRTAIVLEPLPPALEAVSREHGGGVR